MVSSERQIMVVDRATLFADLYFQGFSPAEEMDYEQIVMDNYYYDLRDKVETMPQLKQPIAYAIIVNKDAREVFAYQRAQKDGQYEEKRLRGKWSWGIGGHIDKVDLQDGDPIRASLLRELQEEVVLPEFDPPEILGYINDDQTEVGQVHFGLLYLIRTSCKNVQAREGEITWGGFMPVVKLLEICTGEETPVESWSEIALTPLRQALGFMDEDEEP
ncbi:NUDIX domain-containing protein [candidate division KSB1 bacterium]|nr:NUDIX domain-containing protein [candidate division KSB1 bacterium]